MYVLSQFNYQGHCQQLVPEEAEEAYKGYGVCVPYIEYMNSGSPDFQILSKVYGLHIHFHCLKKLI